MSGLDTIRTDVVGSLLRPAAWKEARLRLDAGLMDANAFEQLELQCVQDHIAMH